MWKLQCVYRPLNDVKLSTASTQHEVDINIKKVFLNRLGFLYNDSFGVTED